MIHLNQETSILVLSFQLNKLGIPVGDKIQFMKLKPHKYKNEVVSYFIRNKTGKNTLISFDKDINPSPPATADENDWNLQPIK
jgi:hypothetical protein